MENDIRLKPKKNNFLDRIKEVFEDRKKRYLYMFLFMLPLIIAIVIFSIIAIREAKSLINLATGNESVNEAYSISSMNYFLRDNATDVQIEYFTELKNAIEKENADDETIVGLVGKNYVADFYTWTNKLGQYDIGGMEYVNSEKNETTGYKDNIYLKARDGFYKYLNVYVNKYGLENLIEVENVDIRSVSKNNFKYVLHEYIETIQTGEDSWEKIYDDVEHDCYTVNLSWSYKQDTKLNLGDYANSINLLIIENDGRYEIVEASENQINSMPEQIIKDNIDLDDENEDIDINEEDEDIDE